MLSQKIKKALENSAEEHYLPKRDRPLPTIWAFLLLDHIHAKGVINENHGDLFDELEKILREVETGEIE